MSNSIRVVIVIVVALMVTLAGASKSPVKACPAFGVHTYYSNDSYSDPVGQIIWYCGCTTDGLSGTATDYVLLDPFDCFSSSPELKR